MGYSVPAFMVAHPSAQAGAGAITPKYAAAAGFGLENLIDHRSGRLFKFAASQVDHDLEVDFSGLPAAPYINRLVIPAGHNFIGTPASLDLYAGATSPAAGFVGSYPTPAGGLTVDWELPGTISELYVRLVFNGAGTWELPELWLGERLELTRGPDPGWTEPRQVPVEVVEFPTREATAILGPARGRWTVRFHNIEDDLVATPDQSDHRTLHTLSELGRGAPLLFWPPSSPALPRIVRLASDPAVVQDSPVPNVKLGRRYELELVEQTS